MTGLDSDDVKEDTKPYWIQLKCLELDCTCIMTAYVTHLIIAMFHLLGIKSTSVCKRFLFLMHIPNTHKNTRTNDSLCFVSGVHINYKD